MFSILNKEQHDDLKYLQPKIISQNLINKFLLFGENKTQQILLKIQFHQNFSLNKNEEVAQGIVPNPDVVSKKAIEKIPKSKISKFNIKTRDGVFVVKRNYFHSLNSNENKILKPLWNPHEIYRYYVPEEHESDIIYLTKENKPQDYPTIIEHLQKYKEIMEERRENKMGRLNFYQLHWGRDKYFFEEGAKILGVRKCSIPTFAYTEKEAYVMMAINVIRSERINMKYLTAILNSKLIAFWLKNKGKMQGSQYQIDKEPIMQIPIYDTENKDIKSEIIKNVELLLNLNEELHQTRFESKIEQIRTRIGQYEKKINEIVYQIYDRTYAQR